MNITTAKIIGKTEVLRLTIVKYRLNYLRVRTELIETNKKVPNIFR